jgi:ATP-binding cassette subfamily C (CFTR/MRP) protein 1
MFAQRKKGVKITDQRVRLLNEVLQGVRLIKVRRNFSCASEY